MIEIKPYISHQSSCPHCNTLLNKNKLLWHGMHICVESNCPNCHAEIIEDMKVGHANIWSYQIDIKQKLVFGDKSQQGWLGNQLLKSLDNPEFEDIKIQKEVLKEKKQVIILNCIDYLYGHCLLKLLNSQKHLQDECDYGLIVITQKFLKWMVPKGVCEIWTVDIPLNKGQCYFPQFNKFISNELQRFSKVHISEAYSHPSQFDISNYTGIRKHDFQSEDYRISFIWREDRIWLNFLPPRLMKKLNLNKILLPYQNRKVIRFFKRLSSRFPNAKFTVIGLGKKTLFPDWIEDLRTDKFDLKTEKLLCKSYSESRLVIGVHGSNMLIPSAQAGMTINLMPKEKWANIAQDILYQEINPRIASFRYRYLPLTMNIHELVNIASTMIIEYRKFNSLMNPGILLDSNKNQ